MEILTSLIGYKIALDPFTVAVLGYVVWIISELYRLRFDMVVNFGKQQTENAVMKSEVNGLKETLSTIQRGQQTIISTMERHHDTNVKTLFRAGGIRIMPGEEAGEAGD